ncbi:MAG: heavy-metal-associated domain-containing protein [Armatimonadetes bacterium]|nr:heavy-metal-associated domain-containing protein [Armatimonadota bacterium]
MKHLKRRLFYVGAILLSGLVMAVLMVNWGIGTAEAMCGMEGCTSHESSGSHSGHSGDADAVHSGHNPASESQKFGDVTLTGMVAGIDKAKGMISIRLDLPLQAGAGQALSGIKSGDIVAATLRLDKSGRAVVASLSQAGGTAVLKLTGIQCPACASRLEKALKVAPGVNQVTVTADPPQATLSYNPTKTNVDALKEVIRDTEPIHAGTPFGVED